MRDRLYTDFPAGYQLLGGLLCRFCPAADDPQTVCPVEAIYYEDDVPEEWTEYISANADFFDDLGSPGGAAKLGPTGKDVPFIAALPPRGE